MVVPAFRFFPVPPHKESTADPPTETHHYKAIGTQDVRFLQSYTLAATPSIVITNQGILYRQDIRITQTHYNHFKVVVPYGEEQNQTGEWTWDFDTTGGVVHITNGKQEVGRFPGTAPDQKGAIGVDGDKVQGTDIVIPAMKINVTYKHPLGIITIPQAKFLSSITGLTNSTPFLTFAPGEVLFLGCRGSDGTNAEVSVNYQFAMSANVSGLSIGDIAGIAKKGWEVAWIRYEDAVDAGNPIRIPKHVYVDRVYDEVDLATALGFGF